MQETDPSELPPSWRRFLDPIEDGAKRREAWIDLLFRDLGILRLFWKNRYQLSERGWRSNQPIPADVRWAKGKGIRAILNARHDAVRHGGHALVREAAAKAGIAYYVLAGYPIFSRTAPTRDAILNAADILQSLPYPALIHCKSGADRAGFLSALFLIVVEGIPVEEARKQLSWRYLHLKGSKTGVLDAVFQAYLDDTQSAPKPFLDWVREDYDPDRVTASFRPGTFADLLDRFILRHE